MGFLRSSAAHKQSQPAGKQLAPNTTEEIITVDYILGKGANYQIDIAGRRFRLTPYLHAPPSHVQIIVDTSQSNYKPTVVKDKNKLNTVLLQ